MVGDRIAELVSRAIPTSGALELLCGPIRLFPPAGSDAGVGGLVGGIAANQGATLSPTGLHGWLATWARREVAWVAGEARELSGRTWHSGGAAAPSTVVFISFGLFQSRSEDDRTFQ